MLLGRGVNEEKGNKITSIMLISGELNQIYEDLSWVLGGMKMFE